MDKKQYLELFIIYKSLSCKIVVKFLSHYRWSYSLLAEVSHDEAKWNDRRETRNLVGGFIKQLVRSWQRSLSSHFSLSHRERPLLAGKGGGAGWGTRPPLFEYSGSVPEICLRISSGRSPIIYRIITHFYHVVCSRNFALISVFITPHPKAWLRVLCKLLKKKLAPWHTYISLEKLLGLGFYKTLHIC